MSGLTEFTTLNVNGAKSPPEYYLLQALELGALPKFEVCAEDTSVLSKARITQYLAAHYEDAAQTIKSLDAAYKAAFARIGTKEIVRHETLSHDVFLTTYANGVRVLVNYGVGTTVGAYELPALGYMIFAEGEEMDMEDTE
jgi:hypothetical protein